MSKYYFHTKETTENVYIKDKKSSPTLIAERYNYLLSPLTYNLLPDSYISIHQWDNLTSHVLNKE